MYYDTIEEAINANPGCTHVLTTGPKWGRSPEQNPDIGGSYVAAVKQGKVFSPLNEEGNTTVDVTAYISPTHWQVAANNNTPQPTQASAKVTAARFDTASGRIPAHEFLEKGVEHMKDRASQRDSEDGERSMKRCVEAFNALEGTTLTETQGWKFMVMLKMARSVSGDFTADDYEDMAAYAGLAGESASMETEQTVEKFPAVTVVESATRYITNQPKAYHSDYKYFMKAQDKPFLLETTYNPLRDIVLNEDTASE